MRTKLSICRKKARYPTEADALLIAQCATIALRLYRCDRCQQFHLTSRTKGKRVARPFHKSDSKAIRSLKAPPD